MAWLKIKFGVESAEINPFLLMLLLSFLVGGGNVFVDAAANALFVSEYGAGQLPLAYIISAVVMILGGFTFAKLQTRLRFARLLSLTMLTIVILTTAIKVGYDVTANPIFVFAVQIWFRFIFVYSDLVFWSVAGVLFSIQQGKRLFGLISTGSIIARIIGAMLVPIIVPLIGSSNLLYLSSIFLTMAWLLIVRILGNHDRDQQTGTSEQAIQGQTTPNQATPYIYLIYAVFGVGSIAYYLIGLNFYAASGARFANDADQLASFFGLFSGIVNICVLLITSLATSSFLRRFGLIRSLFVRPTLSIFLAIGVLFIVVSNSGSLALLFILTMSLRFFDLLIYYGLYRPGLVLLYQPLPKSLRVRVQSITEGVVGSISLGLAGLLILLVGAENIVLNSLALVALLAIWLGLITMIRGEYPRVLQRALYQRLLTDSSLDLSEAETLKTIRVRLDSPNPSDVVYALELLERVGPPDLVFAIEKSLKHTDPLVRETAANRAARLDQPELHRQLQYLAENDAVMSSRAAALRALCICSSAEIIPSHLHYLDAAEPALRKAALIGLCNNPTEQGHAAADRRLAQLMAGTSAEKIIACQVLDKTTRPALQNNLPQLLDDPDPDVQRAALIALDPQQVMTFVAPLLDKLDTPTLSKSARRALATGGGAVLDQIQEAYASADQQRRLQLVQVAGRIDDIKAYTWLLRVISDGRTTLREAAMRGLQRSHFVADTGATTLINQQISAEIKLATTLSAAHDTLKTDDSLTLPTSALATQIAEIRQRIYLLLSLTHDRQLVQRIQENLRPGSINHHAYAIELLETTLKPALRQLVMPLLEPQADAARLAALSQLYKPIILDKTSWLSEMIQAEQFPFSAWVQACTLYTIGQQNEAAFTQPIALASNSAEPLVQNTATWIIESTHSQPVGEHITMMPTIEKVIILRSVSLFATIPEGTLVRIAELLNEEIFEPGHPLFEKGDYGDNMYIIVSGKVRAHIGDETLNFLSDRDVFGEMALVAPAPRSASITTVDRSILLRLNQAPLFELMEDQPAVARGIIRVLSGHLRDRVQDLREARAQIASLESVR